MFNMNTVYTKWLLYELKSRYCLILLLHFIWHTGIDNHNDVYQECKHCSANWYTIGLNLGIPQYALAIVAGSNPFDLELCMSEMLARWLKRVDQKSIPSWRRLCRALCDVDKSTADQIAEKHHVTDYNKQKGLFNYEMDFFV